MTRSPRALFPVAVDPAALLDHPNDRDRQVHRTVVSLLCDHGVVTLGNGDGDALLDAIGALGNDSRDLWERLLGALNDLNRIDRTTRSDPVEESLRTLGSNPELQNALHLVVAGEEHAMELDVDFNVGCRTVADTDVALAAAVDQAPTAQRAARVGAFTAGTPLAQVAEQFLRPLAERSTSVKVVDPHILEDLVKNPAGQPRHVKWLLRELGSSLPTGSEVSLIGTLQNTWAASSRGDVESRIQSHLEDALADRKAPLTVKVTLVQAAKPPLKNRFIWFSCGQAFDVLHNFAPLAADPLKEEIRFTRQRDEIATETRRLADEYEGYQIKGMVTVTHVIP